MNSEATSKLAASIVSSYVSHNPVPAFQLPDLLVSVHRALLELGKPRPEAAPQNERSTPVVPIKKSITPDYIVCLEDGKRFRSMRRHLMVAYGMTPDQYRAKWGLPSDYPIVAPSYSALRSQRAREAGFGRSAPQQVQEAAE